ncbi:Bark storage protein A [Morus notabilis]|uniref:Bark storage protein A n=1 Tax=Morus notabilis TaxID=981085 RepID=W9SCI4_9ROSA|nr:bark storage protein A [Morus notabilis]EXC25442.1 Bark storage protein A [Morus notabilis]
MAKWLGLAILFSQLLGYAFCVPSCKGSRYHLLKKVNRKGPYIGLITVYPTEENAFFSTGAFKPDPNDPFLDFSGRRFRVGKVLDKRVIYVKCGVGLINAAATTQQMLDLFRISGIVHFGIAGNINNSMSIGDVTIPKEFVNTGIWDWLNPNGTVDTADIAGLDVKNYNSPKAGDNLLGHIGFNFEQLYSNSGEPNTAQTLVWAQVNQDWLHVASKLEGIELQQCVNSSLCLQGKPKLVVGLKGSTSDIFVDNAAYRDFLFNTFKVSSTDMESSAVVMTSLSNGFPVIVIRGLSDIAGKQEGESAIGTFGSLAALNTANSVIQLLKELPAQRNRHYI